MNKLLEQRMSAAVQVWIDANPDKIQAAVDGIMKASAGEVFMKYLDMRFAMVSQMTVQTMQSQGLLPR